MESVSEQTIAMLQDLVSKKFHNNISEASRFLKLDQKSGILRKWIKGERSPTLANISSVYELLGVTLNIPGKNVSAELSALAQERDELLKKCREQEKRIGELEAEIRGMKTAMEYMRPQADSLSVPAECGRRNAE